MVGTQAHRGLPGTASDAVQDYERKHAEIARRAAAEGIVLLKNEDNALPLKPGARIALYGAGACHTVKGGIGSGEVNERASVTVCEGLKQAGFEIVTEAWLSAYDAQYNAARLAWKERVSSRMTAEGLDFFTAYSTTPFVAPAEPQPEPVLADDAVIVLSRNAGEAADRRVGAGDYALSDAEQALLGHVCRLHERVIVLVNSGGPIDLSFMDQYQNIRALLTIAQPGMEGGHAVADVLSAKVSPCGKLTDTWAYRFADYPGSASFAQTNKPLEEVYDEGIYVGYRYFDSFGIPVRYGFGEGLSYAQFELTAGKLRIDPDGLCAMEVCVRNVSTAHAGREVVQLYASLPSDGQEKELRRLCAYAKTRTLSPGESEMLTLHFGAQELASYDETRNAWVLSPGEYGLFLGASLSGSRMVASLRLGEEKILSVMRPICPPKRPIKSLHLEAERRKERLVAILADAPVYAYELSGLQTVQGGVGAQGKHGDKAEQIAAKLTTEQLTALVVGDTSQDLGSQLGLGSYAVPGAVGGTSACATDAGVPSMAMADGPAGLRLARSYYVKDGKPLPLPAQANLEHGLFFDESQYEGLQKRYQFCTAFPVGTLLAQSWDEQLLEEVGHAVAEEMRMFGVDIWLAPGMNLHRNPLCGRNFEYYSEDPLISGKCAAAVVRGTQSVPGCAATIKHFACNNREDQRTDSDSVLCERTLHEIYLRGFGIAIKEGKPAAIMTSYNLVNGVHSANSLDLCEGAARGTFGFDGLIMTDWCTTNRDEHCTAAGCIRAGNDLIMPGLPGDLQNIRDALADGSLTRGELETCAARVIRLALRLAGQRQEA